MVMSFFRKKDEESGLDRILHQSVSMLGDARHSFDLACSAVLDGADPDAAQADIEASDERINTAEQRLRSELVVHVAVQGSGDIGAVLGYTLLIKKIERIGDQAKNIFDLALEGVSLVGSEDHDELSDHRREISQMYAQVADLITTPHETAASAFLDRSQALNQVCAAKVREYVHADRPGHWAVPRAILYRYWKRIVANLAGIVTATIEPVANIDYLDHGHVDITDD